jgi:Flp pilus assembly protein TadB
MSESEYRSAREAARARVAVLETKLRDHEAQATKLPEAPHPISDARKKMRARITALRKSRRRFLYVTVVIGAAAVRGAARGTSNGGAALFIIALAVLALGFLGSQPRAEEVKLEKELRALLRDEDREDEEFRVKTAEIRVRIDNETTEQERIEAELSEARVLAEEETEKKS